MDQNRAITRARAFCQAIDEATESPATAMYSANPDESDRATSYYKPVWNVKFNDSKTVAIAAEQDFVCGYRNHTSASLHLEKTDDDSPLLTAAEIKEKALAICNIIGSNEELRYENTHLVKNGNPAKPEQDHNYWLVSFSRIAHEIPYAHQGLVMSFATTGRLMGFSRKFESSAAVLFTPHLSKSQAVDLANEHLLGSSNFQGELAEVTVIYEVSEEQHPILAWELRFKTTFKDRFVVLDDQTGQVIEEYGMKN